MKCMPQLPLEIRSITRPDAGVAVSNGYHYGVALLPLMLLSGAVAVPAASIPGMSHADAISF